MCEIRFKTEMTWMQVFMYLKLNTTNVLKLIYTQLWMAFHVFLLSLLTQILIVISLCPWVGLFILKQLWNIMKHQPLTNHTLGKIKIILTNLNTVNYFFWYWWTYLNIDITLSFFFTSRIFSIIFCFYFREFQIIVGITAGFSFAVCICACIIRVIRYKTKAHREAPINEMGGSICVSLVESNKARGLSDWFDYAPTDIITS